MKAMSIRICLADAARLALLFSAAALANSASAQSPGEGDDARGRVSPPTLIVSGRAEVSAEPDQAVVRLGVVGESAEASGAQDQVNGIMRQVLQAVTALDVPERAVRTEELSLFPVYSNDPPRPDGEPQEPRITGYRASNVVSVELDDLDRIGDVIDAGIEAGANQLQGVSFALRDDTVARSQALTEAVQNARAEAEVLAEAMDVRIDGVSQIIAGDYNAQPPMPYAGARFALAEATPVQPGQVSVSTTVTVVFFLREGSAR